MLEWLTCQNHFEYISSFGLKEINIQRYLVLLSNVDWQNDWNNKWV